MAEWPYQSEKFRFAGHVKRDTPRSVVVWAYLIFFYSWVPWVMINYSPWGYLMLLPTAAMTVALVVTGVRDGEVEAVVCTADGLSVERRLLFGRYRRTNTYRWATISSVGVELRKVNKGHNVAMLVIDTAARRKALQVGTTLNDFDRLLDTIAAMTPQLPYRWVRSDPETSGLSTDYSRVERTPVGGQFGRAA